MDGSEKAACDGVDALRYALGGNAPVDPVGYRAQKVSIERVLNGFIVRVGCQTVVFQSLDEMQEELGNYLAYPKETEERFLKQAQEAI